MQNVIKRELTLNASQERVYAAIADPRQVVKWFPETLEGAYAVGEHAVFGFGEHGKNSIYVVSAEPHHYFAYRWVPGANHFMGDVLSVANTLVEFQIEALGAGRCKLTLTESGFAGLPEAVMKSALEQNSSGWDFMLERLVQYIDVA